MGQTIVSFAVATENILWNHESQNYSPTEPDGGKFAIIYLLVEFKAQWLFSYRVWWQPSKMYLKSTYQSKYPVHISFKEYNATKTKA